MWRKLVQSTYRRKSRDGQPSRSTPDDRLLAHRGFVGDLAFYWSVIENNLDAWIEHIHQYGGAKKIQILLPSTLDRELDYLKAALKKGFVPVEHAESARDILQEIHRLKIFRHTHIHGVVDEFREDGRVVVKHSRVRGSVMVRSVSTYSLAQLARQRQRTYNLMIDLNRLLFSDGFGVVEDGE